MCKEIRAKQTTINRLRQTGGTSAEDIQSIEDEIMTINNASLEEHKQVAAKSHQHHKEMVEHCMKQWKDIEELENKATLSESECEYLSARSTHLHLP